MTAVIKPRHEKEERKGKSGDAADQFRQIHIGPPGFLFSDVVVRVLSLMLCVMFCIFRIVSHKFLESRLDAQLQASWRTGR